MESNDGPKEKKKCLDNDNSTTSKKKSVPKSMDIIKLFLEGGKQIKTKKKSHNRSVEIYFCHFVLKFFSTKKINQSKNKAKLEKNLQSWSKILEF